MHRYALVAAALVGAVVAQNTTVSLPILLVESDATLLASVVDSDSDKTTYALNCEDRLECGLPSGLTVTAGPKTIEFTYSMAQFLVDEDADGKFSYNCDLEGTTKADCTVTASQSFSDMSTSTTDSTVLTEPSDLNYVAVKVTAGATSNDDDDDNDSDKSGNAAMPMITAPAQWAFGGAAAAAALAYGAL